MPGYVVACTKYRKIVRESDTLENILLSSHITNRYEHRVIFVLSGISWDFLTLPGCDEVVMEEIRAFFGKWAESISLRLFPKK